MELSVSDVQFLIKRELKENLQIKTTCSEQPSKYGVLGIDTVVKCNIIYDGEVIASDSVVIGSEDLL